MKKQYIQPTTKIHSVRTSNMLAGSPDINSGYGQQNGPRLGKEEDYDEDFDW